MTLSSDYLCLIEFSPYYQAALCHLVHSYVVESWLCFMRRAALGMLVASHQIMTITKMLLVGFN